MENLDEIYEPFSFSQWYIDVSQIFNNIVDLFFNYYYLVNGI